MFYLELIQNVGLLVALVAVHGQIIRRWKKSALSSKVVSGFLFGFVALIGMMTPVHLMPGLIFDGRSIVLSVAGLFGGPVTAIIAAIMSAAYRMWLGGPGVFMGVGVILESAGLGVAFYYLRPLYPGLARNLYLFAFGLLVHVGMLLLALLLPRDAWVKTMENIAVPVMLIYPAATLLICRLFLDQESRVSAEEALRKSEQRYRDVFDTAPIGIILVDKEGKILEVNSCLLEILGSPSPEATKSINMLTFPLLVEAGISDLFRTCITEIRPIDSELFYTSKWGKEICLRVIITPNLNEQGNVEGCLAVMEDVMARKKAEQAQKESEEKYHIIFRDAPVGMMSVSNTGQILDANYKMLEILGSPGLEHTRKINMLTFPPIIEAGIAEHYNRCLTEGVPDDFANLYTTKWGKETYLRSVITPRFNEQGQVVGCLTVIEDVMQHKMAQDSLYESEKKYKALIETTGTGYLILDSQGKVTDANREYVRLSGHRTLDEIIDRSVVEWTAEHHRELNAAEVARCLQQGYVKNLEIDYVNNKGQVIPVEINATVLGVGESRQIIALCRDITERKQAEAALKNSEERYRQLADVTFEGIVYHDQGVLLQANDQYFQMFGYEPDELIGTQALEKTLTPESYKIVIERIAKQSTESYEATGLKKDGTTFPLEIRVRMMEMDGKVVRSAAISDISRLKNLEAQLVQAQKMEAIGTLAGGIAHDFNNLLQAINGYTELLMMRKKQDDPELDDLKRIYDSTKRGADLVKSLMMFSRRTKPELRPVDLNREIVEVQKILSKTIPKIIQIDLRLSGQVESINADPSQIGQILMNLGINARDAMPDGGTLTVETASVELGKDYCALQPELRPGSYVLLAVSDTGHGMDKHTVEHIFEPFYTTKEVGKGTGLGLATVYGIVKEHNGHITCNSERGHGTTFKIYLPAIQTEKTSETLTEETPIQGGNETILLVEDEDVIRDLGAKLLSDYGYNVITANDGKQALEIYQSEKDKISLIILDLIMPVMDGRKCLVEIFRINPDVKVIIASGVTEEGSTKVMHVKGAKGSIRKPYDSRQLLRLVRQVLDEEH